MFIDSAAAKCIQVDNDLLYIAVFQKLEGRVASDEDLKLSDTLRYYMRDSTAAKDLLYRRLRSLVDYENANKALEKARTKNKEVAAVRALHMFSRFLFSLSLANGLPFFLTF